MNAKDKLKKIPSVEKLLSNPLFEPAIEKYSRGRVTDHIRNILDEYRRKIIKGERCSLSVRQIASMIDKAINAEESPSMRRVVNATGTVIHTNLGRSILPDEALKAIRIAASGAVNLEYDLEQGKRGERDSHVEKLICGLTGAEAATVVNNNAAAVMLALNTLANRKEVIVSRGELVEIGGSFRIPDIIKSSGCRMVEVGTTNRTRVSDYESALTKRTRLLLKVHTSNYRIEGFSESADIAELVKLGRAANLPVLEDLGSGALVDLSIYGLPKEPVVRERIEKGADVVTFSGDKLLGGPQAGIIAGKSELIKKINKNPLKRALRVDKLTIAALEATLKLYLNPNTIHEKLPTLHYLTRPLELLEAIAKEATGLLGGELGDEASVSVEKGASEIGSGALPVETLPTWLVTIQHKSFSPNRVERLFRNSNPPIIGRISNDRFILDVRCIEKAEDLLPIKFF